MLTELAQPDVVEAEYAEVGDPKEGEEIEQQYVGKELAVGTQQRLVGYGQGQANPDELVKKRGLAIYDDMKRDSTVKAVLFIKKYSRLATKWTVKLGGTSAIDRQAAEFYETQLEELPGTVIKMLLSMMSALDYGYSISEKNYYNIKEGQYNGKVGLSSVKSKKPHDFKFDQDEYANILALIQNQGGTDTRLPPSKFITCTWMPEWENPYGTPDLKAAYTPWWQKDVILRFQAMWLERYATPPLLGRYPPGTDTKTQNDLLEMLEDMQFHTTALIPEGIEIDQLKLDRTGSDIYTKAIDKRDTMIARACLIPELLGFTEKGGAGSYALGKKQFDLFIGVLWHLGRWLEELIHEQLTLPFVGWNYQVTEYPQFLFEPLTEESSEVKAKIAATLVGAGLLDPSDPEIQKWLVDYLDILPATKTKASQMLTEAIGFETPFKFYSPDGKDMMQAEVMETLARIELLNDAFEIG